MMGRGGGCKVNTPVESHIACLYFFLAACLTKDTLPAGHQFMINLLVSSLMADQGLENALTTAIAYEVKDPAAILKKDRESSVHLLDLVRQLLGNASSTQTASLKHVCNIYNYVRNAHCCVPSKFFKHEKDNLNSRGVASSKQVRGPQHSILAIANDNQDIETALNRTKVRGPWPPLAPL